MKWERHGMRKAPEYAVWQNMKHRCLNPNGLDYKNYGGRGIQICEKWLEFKGFIADMGIKPTAKHSIERLDNNAGYHPSNCVWGTPGQQARNKRVRHNNKTGLSGVKRRKNGIYSAYISIDDRQIHLGSYKTLFDAAWARRSAETRHWS